jgi:hypothetical protein
MIILGAKMRSSQFHEQIIMRCTVKLLIEMDEAEKEDILLDIATFDKGCTRPEHIGLSIAEVKIILQNMQKNIIDNQFNESLEAHSCCDVCQAPLKVKDNRKVKYRTLYGTVDNKNPRYYSCKCLGIKQIITPLSDLFDGHTAPELKYLEAKWSSLMSYGMTVDLLKDSFPIDEKLSIETVRKNTLNVAKRLDESLEKEQHVYAIPFIRVDPVAFENESTVVGLDGGYLRSWSNKKTNFEMIVGKSIPIEGKSKVLGLVTSEDTKSKRRLYEMLKSQGITNDDGVCFMSDGGESLKKLQTYINPNAKHILEWFHITMKITVLQQYIKGVTNIDAENGAVASKLLESVKWKLWHGKPLDALTKILKLSNLMGEHAQNYSKYVGLIKHISEFFNYISNNTNIIVDYGKRWRAGKRISTAFAESLVNYFLSKRFCKKQQMQWSKKGAHLLVQVRAQVVNGELKQIFKGWYKDFDAGSPEEVVLEKDVSAPALAMAA